MTDTSFATIAPYLAEQPTFCFTTDIEWAPEWAIEDLFALADEHSVRLTPFVTHASKHLAQRFADAAPGAVGLHPNFLPGSTHGSSVGAVIDHVTALWPSAHSFRAHCFYDETRMNRQMAARGFRYDSNLCAFLQPGLVPLRTVTPLIRFPVFWEDDLHSGSGRPWTIGAIEAEIRSPGLKIFNVHPLRVALNVPDEGFFESKRTRFETPSADLKQQAFHGPGTRTLLAELFAYARANAPAVATLDELYLQAVERGVPLAAAR